MYLRISDINVSTSRLGSILLHEMLDDEFGLMIETGDYYPFGKRIAITTEPVAEHAEGSLHATVPTVTSTGSATYPNRWRFSGKDDQSFLNAGIPLLDFGARMYNPTTARWTAADPLAENYYGISPYAYCLGNPVIHVDDDGQMPQVVAGALIGAAVGGIMAAMEGKSWQEIGGAVVGGAVEGALASVTGGASLFGSKLAATALTASVASAVGSTANQLVGEGSVDAKQVAYDAGTGFVFGGLVKSAFNEGTKYVGNRIATEAEQKYSSQAVRSSVEKEVKKEMKMSGINTGGKSGSMKVRREAEGRLATQRDFEFSIANAIRDTKAGDVANDIVAHKVSLLIYNKDEQ